MTIRDGERVRRRVRAPEEVEGPLPAGARVGSVTVLVDGEAVRRVALVTAAEVPEAGTLRVLISVLGVPLTLLAGARHPRRRHAAGRCASACRLRIVR